MAISYALPTMRLVSHILMGSKLFSWLPFQKRIAKGREMIHKMAEIPFERVKRDVASLSHFFHTF